MLSLEERQVYTGPHHSFSYTENPLLKWNCFSLMLCESREPHRLFGCSCISSFNINCICESLVLKLFWWKGGLTILWNSNVPSHEKDTLSLPSSAGEPSHCDCLAISNYFMPLGSGCTGRRAIVLVQKKDD